MPALVPDCVGISLGLPTESLAFTLIAHDDLARKLDVVQYIDDGPCVTAMASGHTVDTTAAGLLDEVGWLTCIRTKAAPTVRGPARRCRSRGDQQDQQDHSDQ